MKLAAVVKVDPGAKGPPAARRLQAYLLDRLGSDLHSVRIAEARLLPVACQNAAKEKPDALVVVGGHATARMAGEIAYQRGMPVAFLPGNGPNVLARRLWGGMNAEAIVDALARHSFETARFEVGSAGGRLFFVSAAFGIVPNLALLRKEMRKARPQGLTPESFLRAARLAQVSLRPRVRVLREREPAFVTAGLVACLRAPATNGHTSPEDHARGLNCRALISDKRFAAAATMLKMMSGRDWQSDALKGFAARRFTIEAGRHVWGVIDDTAFRLSAPLTVEVLPQGIEALAAPFARRVDGNRATSTRRLQLVT